MKDLSHARKQFYIILVVIIAGVFLIALPLVLAGIFSQPEEDEWNGWDKKAIEYLQQQEELADCYSDEHTLQCTRAYYGYTKGEPMYDSEGTLLPTDIKITIVVYKGPALFAFVRDEYEVYFLRNDDGKYRVDRYEIKTQIGSLIWQS